MLGLLLCVITWRRQLSVNCFRNYNRAFTHHLSWKYSQLYIFTVVLLLLLVVLILQKNLPLNNLMLLYYKKYHKLDAYKNTNIAWIQNEINIYKIWSLIERKHPVQHFTANENDCSIVRRKKQTYNKLLHFEKWQNMAHLIWPVGKGRFVRKRLHIYPKLSDILVLTS